MSRSRADLARDDGWLRRAAFEQGHGMARHRGQAPNPQPHGLHVDRRRPSNARRSRPARLRRADFSSTPKRTKNPSRLTARSISTSSRITASIPSRPSPKRNSSSCENKSHSTIASRTWGTRTASTCHGTRSADRKRSLTLVVRFPGDHPDRSSCRTTREGRCQAPPRRRSSARKTTPPPTPGPAACNRRPIPPWSRARSSPR